MTDQNTRPSIIDRYLQVALEYSRLEKLKKELRVEALQALENGDWDDISTTKTTKTTYYDDLIIAWISEEYKAKPDVVKACSKRTLDWEGFHTQLKLGEIDIRRTP